MTASVAARKRKRSATYNIHYGHRKILSPLSKQLKTGSVLGGWNLNELKACYLKEWWDS